VNHRDLCRVAARWLVSPRGRHLHAACYELAFDGGVADAVGISCPDPAADVAFRAREYQQLRAIAAAKMERRMARKGTLRDAQRGSPLFSDLKLGDVPVQARHHSQVERHGPPVVAVVECKVSRSDFLADVREQKLRRYERGASENWIAAPLTAYLSPAVKVPKLAMDRLEADAVLALLRALADDGLPSTWGVLVARDAGALVPIRDAFRGEVEAWEVVGWSGRIAASYSHRALGAGPMAKEIP
jgi:hypothetical protein